MKSGKGKSGLFFVFILALSLVVGNLLPGKAAAQQRFENFYWGSFFELTGPGASWGEPSLNAVRLAVEEVNAAGGFKVGGKWYKIVLIEGDSEGKTEKSVAVVTKQLNEHHPLIFSGPGISITAAPIIEMVKARKDFINISHATVVQMKTHESPLLFATVGKSAWTAPDIVDYAADKIGIKSVAMMAGSDEFGHIALEKEYAPQFKRRGITVTDTVYFPPETQDFYPFLSRIKPHKPDAILVGYYDAHVQGIIRQALELGITKKFMNRGGSVHGALPHKDRIDSYIWSAIYDMDNAKDPGILAYKERFKKRYGRYPDNAHNDACGLINYDFVPMTVKAIQAAGTVTDVDAIAKALVKTQYTGAVGKIYFRDSRHAMYRFDGGHMQKGGKIIPFPVFPKPELVPN